MERNGAIYLKRQLVSATIPYDPNPLFAPLHNFLSPIHDADLPLQPSYEGEKTKSMRIGVGTGGYGSGKTYMGAWETLRQAHVNRPVPAVVLAPNLEQARTTSFLTITTMLDKAGFKYDAHWHNRHQIVITATKTQKYPKGERPVILWVSFDKPEKLKGMNLGYIWCDEFGLLPEHTPIGETVLTLILARLRSPDAVSHRLLLTGTPEGLGWTYRMLYTDACKPAGVLMKHCKARTKSNKYLSTAYYEQLREQMTADEAMALLEGEFIDLRQGVAYRFKDAVNLKEGWYDPCRDIHISYDFNRSPGMHVVIGQLLGPGDVSDPRSWFQVIHEIMLPGAGTEMASVAVDNWLAARGHNQGVVVYGDPSGSARKTSSDTTDIDIIASTLRRWKPYMRFRKDHLALGVSVDALNRLLEHGRIRINAGCSILLNDLRSVQWKRNARYPEVQLDKGDARLTHMSDALRYLTEQLFPTQLRLSGDVALGGAINPFNRGVGF